MNTRLGARVFAAALVAALGAVLGAAACGPAVPAAEEGGRLAGADGAGGHGAGERRVPPELPRVLEEERRQLAAQGAAVEAARARVEADPAGDPALVEAMLAAEHDRVARARFVRHLERCAAREVACPPELAEPVIPAAFDDETGRLTGTFAADEARWPAAARAIAASACACRTRRCVAWVSADLERWEDALSPPAQDAGDAGEHVTAARGCLRDRLGR